MQCFCPRKDRDMAIGDIDLSGFRPTAPEAAARPRNAMLSQLPPAEYGALMKSAVPVDLPAGFRMSEPGQPVEAVYFPVSGLVAIDALTTAGESVQIALMGREGMAGYCGLLGQPQMMHTVCVQSPGTGLRVRMPVAREEFQKGGMFTHLVHAYLYMQMSLMAQSVLCNRLHSVERRLARWLLTSADLLESSSLYMTQEALAQMLGSRRSTVTVAAGELQEAGLVDYKRGKIRVLNRPGLEEVACECYRVVRSTYDRMLPKMAHGDSGGRGSDVAGRGNEGHGRMGDGASRG